MEQVRFMRMIIDSNAGDHILKTKKPARPDGRQLFRVLKPAEITLRWLLRLHSFLPIRSGYDLFRLPDPTFVAIG